MSTEIPTRTKTIDSANVLRVRVGTTGLKGGDAGHGCRTVLEIRDLAGTYMQAEGDDESVRIQLGGDAELITFIGALQFALETLREQAPDAYAQAQEELKD